MNKTQKIIILILTLIVVGEGVLFFTTRKTQSEEIKKEETPKVETTEYQSLTFIDFSKYKELMKSEDKSIIVLVQTTCGYCNEYKPILNNIAKEHSIPIYILDLMKMSDSEITSLQSSSSYFTENSSWGTPLTLVVGNNKVVDSLPGFVGELPTTEFYYKNGLIK